MATGQDVPLGTITVVANVDSAGTVTNSAEVTLDEVAGPVDQDGGNNMRRRSTMTVRACS